VNIVTVNAGSTSLKVDLVRDGVRVGGWDTLESVVDGPDGPADAVAHRIVYGGGHSEPAVVDTRLRDELDGLAAIDPLHMGPALEALDTARRYWPDVPHVACFDTAFHTSIPASARRYALPQPWRDRVPAYGFHGLSHAWSAVRVRELAPDARLVVVAHLGGGSSLCGIDSGRSRVTTMGFTPLDGLVMATRVGAIDPGAVLWLSRQPDIDLDDLLSYRSGLQGLAGSADMRDVLSRAAAGDADANFALDVYEHRFVTQLGACVAAIGGIDVLVFTGGIGEHAPALRERLCRRLGWLGVALDGATADSEPDSELTSQGSHVRVFVIAAREDLIMADQVLPVVSAN